MDGNSNTPGSWPAMTAKNPVVPTTVNKNAACKIKPKRMQDYILNDAAVVPKTSVKPSRFASANKKTPCQFLNGWLEQHLHHF